MLKICSVLEALGILVLSTHPSYAQDEMVKLVRSDNYLICGYHNGCYQEKSVLIQVKNVAYTKEVYAHHSLPDGVWIDVPAHYVRPGDSTYELWGIDYYEFDDFGPYGDQFVLKYIVNGQTYWDNNKGNNYHLDASTQTGAGPMLGNDINVLLRQAWIDGSTGKFSASVDVRNIAYTKSVAVVYTTDNWQSTATLNASYVPIIQTGWSTFLYFPNSYNIERWSGSTSVGDACLLQFYIAYTVDGMTYYDNNYGANYTAACD